MRTFIGSFQVFCLNSNLFCSVVFFRDVARIFGLGRLISAEVLDKIFCSEFFFRLQRVLSTSQT